MFKDIDRNTEFSSLLPQTMSGDADSVRATLDIAPDLLEAVVRHTGATLVSVEVVPEGVDLTVIDGMLEDQTEEQMKDAKEDLTEMPYDYEDAFRRTAKWAIKTRFEEDAFQQAMLEVWQFGEKFGFENQERALGLARVMTRRRQLDIYRSQKRHPVSYLSHLENESVSFDLVSSETAERDVDVNDMVVRALGTLSSHKEHQLAIYLVDVAGLTGPEAARYMGKKPGAFRTMLHRARATLKATVSEQDIL